MSKTIRIDPVTRVEGHLSIETSVADGKIVDAKVAGRMYRGFEKLLLGRHPVDAARITQRICGICHEVHGIAASLALEDLYGLQPTPNGRILRELILALHLVTDHIFHFYQLTLPDYVNFKLLDNYRGKDDRINKLKNIISGSTGTFKSQTAQDAFKDLPHTLEMALSYAEAVNIRKLAGSGLASLGGKVPFSHSILPGGLTTEITSAKLMNFANAVWKTAEFVKSQYLPQALSLAEHFSPYFKIGQSHGNFYSNGGFFLRKRPVYTAGIILSGNKPEAVFIDKIKNDVESTYLDENGEINQTKKGAYSWVTAINYHGAPMEVGPLARLRVNNDQGFLNLLKPFGQKQVESSVMARILARAYEAEQLCEYILDVIEQYQLSQPSINPPDMLAEPSGIGTGMSIAARGALNHQITADRGRVVSYRLQMPSAWNFGPQVSGQPGTVEQALLGTPVDISDLDDKGKSLVVGRIVRSFDPCLACAIH